MTHSFPPRLSSDLIPAELSITDAATIHRVAREPRDQLADDARCDQRQAEIQADLIRLPAIRPPHERGIPGAGTGHDHRRESEAGVVIQEEATATAHEAQQRRVVTQCVAPERSEEHKSELKSLMRISYAVFCLNKKNTSQTHTHNP